MEGIFELNHPFVEREKIMTVSINLEEAYDLFLWWSRNVPLAIHWQNFTAVLLKGFYDEEED